MKIGKYDTHPAADLLPLLEGDEYKALCKSIIERGLEKPIELFEGKVLDGRNRLRACLEMHKEPQFSEWKGADPYEYVWAHNAIRRHLEPGQRAMIRLKVDAAIRAEAERKRAAANESRAQAAKAGKVGRAAKKLRPAPEVESDVQSRMPASETKPNATGSLQARELAARADVGIDTAKKATAVASEAPELADQVAAGKVELADAYRQVKGIPHHSRESAEWFTPEDYVEAARRALGGRIDVDPASCAQANETVQAEVFYTEDDNGLARNWEGNVFLNPPGGLVPEFWERLVALWEDGEVERAIWIGYSLEQLQTLQRFETMPLDFILCIPRRRIAFVAPGGGKASPTHANYIAFLPSRTAGELEEVRRFQEAFEGFGAVVHWYRTRAPLPAIEPTDQGVEDDAIEWAKRVETENAAARRAEHSRGAEDELPQMDDGDWMDRPAGAQASQPPATATDSWEQENADLIGPAEDTDDGMVAEFEDRRKAEVSARESERRFQASRAAASWPKRIEAFKRRRSRLSGVQRKALDALAFHRIAEESGHDSRPPSVQNADRALLQAYTTAELAELALILDEENAIRDYQRRRRPTAQGRKAQ